MGLVLWGAGTMTGERRLAAVALEDLTKEELTRLLHEAEEAHGQYEKEELGGVRDEEWAQWYAEFIVNALRERGTTRSE
ncbi:MAG: hypothetical protein ACRDK9_12105 [Solirubrobacterales bacterium]